MAYVVFQALGEHAGGVRDRRQPEAQLFDAGREAVHGGGRSRTRTRPCRSTRCSGLDDRPAPGRPPRVAFNYHVDLAGARLVVLDTRNHREYLTPNGPPGLLTQEALDAQLPIALTDDVPLLIVVSPAPVMGPRRDGGDPPGRRSPNV